MNSFIRYELHFQPKGSKLWTTHTFTTFTEDAALSLLKKKRYQICKAWNRLHKTPCRHSFRIVMANCVVIDN